MDLQLILKAIDDKYGLSEEYPDQMFDVTSTKFAVVLHSADGKQFYTSRKNFSDNQLFLLDSELSKALESNTNLIYCTSNNDSNNSDKLDEEKKDNVHLEQILKTIDEMHNLSKKYPDQLFDVTSTKSAVILHSTAGEQFHTLRSSFFDDELFPLDIELKKASKRNMNLIYRTSKMNIEEEKEEEVEEFEDLYDILENSVSAKFEMAIIQSWVLDATERGNKKSCSLCSSIKKELKDYIEIWVEKTTNEIKDDTNATQTSKVERKVDELIDNLETLSIIKRDVPDGGKRQDKTAMFFNLRSRCCICGNLELQDYQTYRDAVIARYKYGKNELPRNWKFQYKKFKTEIRKRKRTNAITEMDQKKQKLDRRKDELSHVCDGGH